jgi:hypothetical protein
MLCSTLHIVAFQTLDTYIVKHTATLKNIDYSEFVVTVGIARHVNIIFLRCYLQCALTNIPLKSFLLFNIAVPRCCTSNIRYMHC